MFFSLLSAHAGEVEIDGQDYYAYADVWTEYANSLFVEIFFYLAIAMVAVMVAVGIIVRLKKPESFFAFVKGCALIAAGFIVTVLVVMLALGFAEIEEKGYADYDGIRSLVYIPAIVLGSVVALGLIASYIASLFGRKTFKITLITAASVAGAALVALLICLIVYLNSGNAEINNGAEITSTENALLYVCAAGLIVVIALLAFLFGKGEKKEYDSKSISYAGICIAMSFALSYIKFFEMPQGGSLTLASLLPLMIYSYMYGVRKGVVAGFAYGILQAVQDPWLIHPAQFLLDYPVAFSAIGLAGMFSRVKALDKLPQLKFTLGAIVGCVLRYISHILSGVFAFSEYSTLDNVWIYSMAYNSFVFIDIAIAIAVGIIVFSTRSFNAQVRKVQTTAFETKKSAQAEQPAQTND